MPVNNQHDDYKRMVAKWERCRDVADGQDAVHAAGEKYLPKLKDQLDADYRAYVGRATFYNATWRTIAGLNGMLFRKPPAVEVPDAVRPLLDDVTMSGVPLQMLAEEVCEEALKCGRLGVLVDYPQADAARLTLADARRLNLRPMMQLYRAESIINWKEERVDNVCVLTQVVLKERAAEATDEFTTKQVDRYRVLDLAEGRHYRVRVFEMRGDQQVLLSEVVPLLGARPLAYIPFTFLSSDDNTAEVDEPPLIDLVNVNLSHYRSTADLEHGAHFTGLPTPWISGHRLDSPSDKLYIGSTAAWVFPNENARAEYLEFKGEGLRALQALVDSKEKQMAVLGARMLEPQKRGVEAADTVSIHRKGEESMLSMAAQSISLGMTRALRWFAGWAGADAAKAKFELNRDFYPAPMTDKMLTALVSAWQQGAFSDQVLFENLQAGEVIAQDDTLEIEQARIGSAGPRLAAAPTANLKVGGRR
jgi:hypothetical protein